MKYSVKQGETMGFKMEAWLLMREGSEEPVQVSKDKSYLEDMARVLNEKEVE